MSNMWLVMGVVVLAAAAMSALARGKGAQAARAAVAAGAPIVDVRGQGEWDSGHLAKSTLIPLPQIQSSIKRLEQLVDGDRARPIVLVCRSGARAGQAKAFLQAQGFTNVINAGGWTNLR